jgi:thymidylate synthase
MPTYDLGPTTILLRSSYDALPLGTGRGLNVGIAAAEAAQLVAGYVDHTLLPRISPAFKQFLDPDTQRFHGAYGDRIGTQIRDVVRRLKRDPDTRQAVVTLWNPLLDNASARDIPCTVALNFAVVAGKLELRTQMRSNDIWLGFPYDVFMFTQLQQSVARALELPPGPYTHGTWSLHLYKRDIERVEELRSDVPESVYQPTGFGAFGESWLAIQRAARAVLDGTSDGTRPLSERWYVDSLSKYITAKP